MLYAIENDGLYLSSNGQYVNQSGLIGTGAKPPIWVRGKLNGLGTTDFDHAQAIADRYGGKVVQVA
jgi:hypothetical protein